MRFDVKGWVDDRLGVRNTARGRHGIQLVADCPFCGHASKLWIAEETGLWTCYKCNAGGGIVGLVVEVDGLSYAEARKFVRNGGAEERIARPVEELVREQARAEAPAPAAGSDQALPTEVELPEEFVPIWNPETRIWNLPLYARERGIWARTALAFRLGFCLEGRYAGRLIFPAHVNGRVRTFQGRAMGPWEPKYLGPSIEGGALFGYDEAVGGEEIVVCEGPMDVLSLVQKGIPAVGLMGKVASPAQAVLVARAGFRRAIVLLDKDAGPDGVEVAITLGEVVSVRTASLPTSKDPSEAPVEEIREALLQARPPRIRERNRRAFATEKKVLTDRNAAPRLLTVDAERSAAQVETRRGAMSRRDGIGCKGGTSATAGQTSAVYEIELPDGTKIRKRTFKAQGETAVACLSRWAGRYYVDAVHDTRPTWANDTAVARRVS